MHDEHVKEGKAIQRETGKTFHIATRLLPERIRHPTYVLYGFFRIADEVVDDPDGLSREEQSRRLEELRAQALGEEPADDPVLEAFAELCETYEIDDAWVNEFVDAMATDIDTDRYETYADLEDYMRGSAAAVGVMMTDIMHLDEEAYEQALPHAIKLGEAFQLSNFVRDVHEDVVERDRVYLPEATLERCGADVADVKDLEFTPEIQDAIAAETARADELYREGVAGIRYLPEDCQLAVLLAAVLYAEHHRVVRKRDYDTVTVDVDLPTWRKLWCLVRTRWHWQWNKDPEAVFRRVSAVPYDDRHADDHHEEGASGSDHDGRGALGRVRGWLPSW
ncbi:phytoene/squalene synthase family protein [Halorubellus sp. PRR65]|uniref:phytoene/squalene synthase family protein n=1 Tax=Halorubellus sp. PRR65 TaxID=3098148 RepID=UPI002B25919C|nr:phytoene/squalene synthase family protein [Halorubellus sp. PRR65]